MLKADEINALRDTAESLTEPIVRYLLRDLAGRVARAGRLTGTAQYEMWKLQQLGLSQKEIREKLRALLRVSGDGLEKLLTQSAEAGYRFDLRNLPTEQKIPFSENGVLQQIVSSAVKLARQDLENLTQTMGMIDPYGHFQPLRQAYVKCMDYAFMQVSTGAADYNTAIRQATKNLADMGVQVVDYRSGLHTNLETVVRRNVMSSMGLMQEQISRQNHDAIGADGWEIDAHYNSAPDHEPIQGKQYSDDAYTALNNSLVRRIGTLNCGHSAYPIHLGIDSPQYTAQELERMRQSNEKGITFRGLHYTGYGATQKQRRLETAIRRQRHRILVDEAVGDGEKLRTDRMKLTALNQEYRAFSEEAGLRMQHERMEVVGYNWKQEAAAEETAKNHERNLQFIYNDATIKAESSLPKRVEETDTVIPCTVNVNLPKIQGVVPKGAIATDVYTMAGDGTSTPIRDLRRLYSTYPDYGEAKGWKKKSGTVYAKHHHYVIHWYENTNGVPPDEVKLKGAK